MNTKDIYCVKDQKVTAHKAEVDGNGEIVFTCTTKDCGRFLKFPADVDKAKIEELVKKHEEGNTGQVSIEEQEAKLKEMLGAKPEK